MTCVVIAAGCADRAAGPPPAASAEAAPVGGERTVELRYEAVVSDIPAGAERVRLWMPLPRASEVQSVDDYAFEGPGSWEHVEEPEYGNAFIQAELGAGDLDETGSAAFRLTATVTRAAYSLDDGTLPDEPLGETLRRRYLSPDRLVPIDGRIAEEAERVAGDETEPRVQARRLYESIVDTVSYDKSGTGWGRGDAIYACDVRTGNCTDFHSLFIGEARALGIPARFVMGLPLPPDEAEGEIGGYHCWAEFYLDEEGWAPIDASEAHKRPEMRETFFAGLDEHRVEFTRGRDITLPGAAGEPLNYAIYPHVEVDGVVHPTVEHSFTFRSSQPATRQEPSGS